MSDHLCFFKQNNEVSENFSIFVAYICYKEISKQKYNCRHCEIVV